MAPKTHLVCFWGKTPARFTRICQIYRWKPNKTSVCLQADFISSSFLIPQLCHCKTNSSGWEQLRKKNTFLHVQACWSGNTCCKGLDCDQFQVKPCSLMYVCINLTLLKPRFTVHADLHSVTNVKQTLRLFAVFFTTLINVSSFQYLKHFI